MFRFPVPTIVSERLELVSMSPRLIEALLAPAGSPEAGSPEAGSAKAGSADAGELLGAAIPQGWPDAHDERFLRLRGDDLRAHPEIQQWLLRAVVLPEGKRLMIGHVGFHDPPDDAGVLEVGYTIFPSHRRRGYAHEAVGSLMAWATATHGVTRFRASIGPDNHASLSLAGRLGFRQTGRRWDEIDGEEIVFERAV